MAHRGEKGTGEARFEVMEAAQNRLGQTKSCSFGVLLPCRNTREFGKAGLVRLADTKSQLPVAGGLGGELGPTRGPLSPFI